MGKNGRRFIVGIAGSSGSGKTTLAERVLARCGAAGVPGQIFSLDNYYKALGHLSTRERAKRNFDHPDALDFRLAARQLKALRAGCAIDQPRYDFKRHTRRKKTVRREPTPLVLVEGIYALYPKALPDL